MDILSAAATALGVAHAAWQLGVEIYGFVQATKNVNETVRSLVNEVKQLGDICNSVSEQLKLLPSLGKDDVRLLTSIDTQLTNCRKVIAGLDSALDSVRQNKRGFFKQAIRQTKFEISEGEIEDFRKQIHIQITNLQLSLQLLNLKMAYLAPQLANETLLQKLAELQSVIERHGPKLDKSLAQCADDYHSKGTTLYEDSVASASVAGTDLGSKAPMVRDWLARLDALRIDEVETVPTHGSDDSIEDWAQPGRHKPARADSVQISGIRRSDDVLSTAMESLDSIDANDNKLALEFAEVALESGHDAFIEKNFEEAAQMLLEAVTLLESLPARLRQGRDLEEIHFKLAICSFFVQDLPTAEAALASVVERESVSREDALRKSDAGIFLAQVYIRQGKLDLARFTCESVYRSRRSLLQKDDELCHESLALLVRTYTLLGLGSRANIYGSMIPTEKREHFSQMFDFVTADSRAVNDAADLATNDTSATLLEERTRQVVDRTPSGDRPNILELRGSGDITCVACSYDGSKLATGVARGDGGLIELRDIASGKVTLSLSAPWMSKPVCLAISPDGTRLASHHLRTFSERSSIKIWSLDGQGLLYELFSKKDEAAVVMTFSPNNSLIASIHLSDSDAFFHVWDITASKKRYKEDFLSLKAHPLLTCSAAFSPSGDVLVVQCPRPYMINVSTFKPMPWKEGVEFELATWRADGTLFALQSNGQFRFHLSRATHGMTIGSPLGYDRAGRWRMAAMGLMRNQQPIAFATRQSQLAVSDVEAQTWHYFDKLFALYGLPKEGLDGVHLSADCSTLITRHSYSKYRVWDVEHELQKLRELDE